MLSCEPYSSNIPPTFFIFLKIIGIGFKTAGYSVLLSVVFKKWRNDIKMEESANFFLLKNYERKKIERLFNKTKEKHN